jgi:hypothetical protein
MASSKRTFTIPLRVETAEKFTHLYGHRIGPDKEFENRTQALHDMVEGVFIEYYGVKRWKN